MLGCVLDMLDTGASMLDVLGWVTGVPQNPMRGQHPMFASPCRPPPKVGAPPKFWGGVGDGGWKPRGGWPAWGHSLWARVIDTEHSFSNSARPRGQQKLGLPAHGAGTHFCNLDGCPLQLGCWF